MSGTSEGTNTMSLLTKSLPSITEIDELLERNKCEASILRRLRKLAKEASGASDATGEGTDDDGLSDLTEDDEDTDEATAAGGVA